MGRWRIRRYHCLSCSCSQEHSQAAIRLPRVANLCCHFTRALAMATLERSPIEGGSTWQWYCRSLLAWLFRAQKPNINEKRSYIVPVGLQREEAAFETCGSMPIFSQLVKLGIPCSHATALRSHVQSRVIPGFLRRGNNTLASSKKISRPAEHFHKVLWKAQGPK